MKRHFFFLPVLLFFLPVLLPVACSSPKVVTQTVEVRHDTVRQIVLQHDTLTTADSVITFIHERGDTLILRERVVRTKDRIVMRHDTVVVEREATTATTVTPATTTPMRQLRYATRYALLAALLASLILAGWLGLRQKVHKM